MQPSISNLQVGLGCESRVADSSWKRFVCLLALLFLELIFLSVWFDTGVLSSQSGGLSWLVGQSPIAVRFGIVVMAIMLGFSAGQLRKQFSTALVGADALDRRWSLYLLTHFAAFAIFFGITQLILATDALIGPSAGLVVIGWLGASVFVGTSWALALMPFQSWWTLLQQTRGIVLVGCVIGATALVSGLASASLWRPMSSWTLTLVQSQLGLVTSDIVCQPSDHIIGTGAFAVQINGSCSGYEGIGLIWVFLATYFWFFRSRLRFPHAFLLVPLGTVLIWVFNSFRITTLILIGNWGWPEVALGGFHSQAGWLAFCGVGMAMVAVSSRSSFLANLNVESARSPGQSISNPAAPYLVPFLAVLVTTMLAASLSSGASSFYPIRVIAVCAVLWCYRRSYRRLQFAWSWNAVAIGATVAAVWLLVLSSGGETVQPSGSTEASSPAGWSVLGLPVRILGYVVLTPVVEELAFRGYLTRRLIDFNFTSVPFGKFTWFSCLGSALVFGLMHGSLWLPGTFAGVMFAAAMYRHGRVADAMLAHAVTNGLIALYAGCVGEWSLLS